MSLDINTNDAFLLPVGTDAQRPTGIEGMIRYNSQIKLFEGYNGDWTVLGGVIDSDKDLL